MNTRKKSPRAPSIPLDEAIERVTKVYEKERRHAAPTDVVAQDMGYKSANNGSALSTLASIRYFGLLERPKDGHLAVSKDFESYNFAPNESMRLSILHKWMRNPPVFSDLLEKYADGLPSDATIRFDLIQQGFSPPAAESVISVFKRSAEFSGVFESSNKDEVEPAVKEIESKEVPDGEFQPAPSASASSSVRPTSVKVTTEFAASDTESDQIPVRLSKGRRAWLVIPQPFYRADKDRLKAQIDLLITEDDEED